MSALCHLIHVTAGERVSCVISVFMVEGVLEVPYNQVQRFDMAFKMGFKKTHSNYSSQISNKKNDGMFQAFEFDFLAHSWHPMMHLFEIQLKKPVYERNLNRSVCERER